MDILCHPENNDRGQWLSYRKTNTQAKTWGKRSEHWFTSPRWTMNLDEGWHWIMGEELDWCVAAPPIRKTEVQVNPVSSPSSESYLSTEFQMGTKKVRESLESVWKQKVGPWSRAPGWESLALHARHGKSPSRSQSRAGGGERSRSRPSALGPWRQRCVLCLDAGEDTDH